MKTIIRRISAENGMLYCVRNGHRNLLAKCMPEFKIIEKSASVPTLGTGCRVKRLYFTIVLCDGMELTRNVDVEFLKTVSQFELTADVWESDGMFERIRIDRMTADEIDLGGTWTFEVDDPFVARRRSRSTLYRRMTSTQSLRTLKLRQPRSTLRTRLSTS